jgi:biofilm PGA synthesis N-glycosyltransferase PgaC
VTISISVLATRALRITPRMNGFGMSIGFALAWLWLSTWLALPWLAELSLLIGVWPAWIVIGGIALLPGFMNAFLVSTLLTAQRGPSHFVPGSPGVSVLVAAYNDAGNIAASLRSLCKTRYPGTVELIVIDDGSSDGTAAIIRTLFPQVVLIEQGHNQGKAAALNRGLAIALTRSSTERVDMPWI